MHYNSFESCQLAITKRFGINSLVIAIPSAVHKTNATKAVWLDLILWFNLYIQSSTRSKCLQHFKVNVRACKKKIMLCDWVHYKYIFFVQIKKKDSVVKTTISSEYFLVFSCILSSLENCNKFFCCETKNWLVSREWKMYEEANNRTVFAFGVW